MVVIHLKKSDADQFLFECTTKDSNDAVVRELCAISNHRERIGRLASACEELAKHGPAKPEAERGLDELAEKEGKVIKKKGPHYCADPLGNRTGDAPPPPVQEAIRKTCADAVALCSKATFAAGMPLTAAALVEKIDLIRAAVTMGWPGGLPAWDVVHALLHDPKDEALAEIVGGEYLDPETSSLWWAGKELFRDQTVGDRVGKNEKTKVVARLQKRGGGAPVREPAVSEEERKAMLAFYFKKQEEEKKLAEDADDSYLAAHWADPRALKAGLLGTGGIAWKPGAASGGSGTR